MLVSMGMRIFSRCGTVRATLGNVCNKQDSRSPNLLRSHSPVSTEITDVLESIRICKQIKYKNLQKLLRKQDPKAKAGFWSV